MSNAPDGIRKRFISSIGDFGIIEQLINQMVASVPGIHYVVKNRAGQFIMMDEVFLKKLKMKSVKDIVGKTDYDIFPCDVAESYTKDDESVMSSGKSMLNRIEVIPEGEHFLEWWVTNKFPVSDKKGKVVGLAAITSKLSQQRMPSVKNKIMHKVALYVSEHYGENVKLTDLAEVAKMSVRTFNRNFRECFDTSPLKYVNQVRLNAACNDLVQTDDSISDIALRCGFFDQSHMTREFRSKFSVTPRSYRNRHQLKSMQSVGG